MKGEDLAFYYDTYPEKENRALNVYVVLFCFVFAFSLPAKQKML